MGALTFWLRFPIHQLSLFFIRLVKKTNVSVNASLFSMLLLPRDFPCLFSSTRCEEALIKDNLVLALDARDENSWLKGWGLHLQGYAIGSFQKLALAVFW